MAKLLAKLAASAALWAPLKASNSAQVNVAPAPAVVVGRGEDEEPLAEPGWATSSSEGVGGAGACRLTVLGPQGPRPSAGRSGSAAVVSGPGETRDAAQSVRLPRRLHPSPRFKPRLHIHHTKDSLHKLSKTFLALATRKLSTGKHVCL